MNDVMNQDTLRSTSKSPDRLHCDVAGRKRLGRPGKLEISETFSVRDPDAEFFAGSVLGVGADG